MTLEAQHELKPEVAPRESGLRRLVRLETFYRIGVVVKGIDGLLEITGAIVLIFAPGIVHSILAPLEQPIYGDHPFRLMAWHWAWHLDQSFAGGAPLLVVIFLIGHGAIKVGLSYTLLREFHWVYPYALAAMGLFLLYEGIMLARGPSVGLALFTAIDVIITILIWREWKAVRKRA